MTAATEPRPSRALRGLHALRAAVRERRAILALGLLFVAFLGLALVARSADLREWDAELSRAAQASVRGPLVTRLAVGLTVLGNGLGLALCGLPAILWLLKTRRPRALTLLYAAIGGHLLNVPLKLTVLRPRPGAEDEVEVLYRSAGTSFPSGHAMTAVMFFGFWAFLVWVHVARPARRLAGAAALALAALAVCWSRVYLGGHFVSDIVGGIAAGLFFLLLWAAAYRRVGAAELTPPPADADAAQPE